MKNQKYQLACRQARPGGKQLFDCLAWPADWVRLSNRSGRPGQAEKKRPVGSSGPDQSDAAVNDRF
jgi:hypothetical protein